MPTVSAATKPKALACGSVCMLTPVKAPQLGQILAAASICLPQVLQLGMAQPFRPEQRSGGYGADMAGSLSGER